MSTHIPHLGFMVEPMKGVEICQSPDSAQARVAPQMNGEKSTGSRKDPGQRSQTPHGLVPRTG